MIFIIITPLAPLLFKAVAPTAAAMPLITALGPQMYDDPVTLIALHAAVCEKFLTEMLQS